MNINKPYKSTSVAFLSSINVRSCCSNRSIAEFKVGEFENAAFSAFLGSAVKPNSKCHFRRASSLLKTSNFKSALFIADYGAKTLIDDLVVDFKKLYLEIKKHRDAPKPTNFKNTSTEREERKKLGIHDNEMPADAKGMLNNLFSMFGGSKKMKLCGIETGLIDIPNFHTEYSIDGLFPKKGDFIEYKNKLFGWFEDSRFSEFISLMSLESWRKEKDMPTLVKRLHGIGEASLKWYNTSPMGDIRFHPVLDNAYSSHIVVNHSFGNSSYKKEILTFGTTHIAIGFVDFGLLLSSRFVGAKNLKINWIGYEVSPYSVAKSLVILKMIVKKSPVESIFQVWFSSTWSIKTEEDFLRNLKLVLVDASGFSREVLEFLKFWMTSGSVSLQEARKRWLANQTRNLTAIANILSKTDRSRYISYLLSGQLLDGDIGSIVMFRSPPHSGELSLDENFLECVPFDLLLQNRSKTTSFVQAGIDFFVERLKKVSSLIQNGSINIRLNHARVEMNSNVAAQIKKLNPYSISWSNISDYMSPSDFFKLAKEVSSPNDTVHFITSMNWPVDVKGSMILDYDLNDLKEVHQGTMEMQKIVYESSDPKMKTFLQFPPVDDVRNIVDSMLRQQFFKNWVDKFMKVGRIDARQFAITGSEIYSVFSRSSTAINITFTFDSEINFEIQQ